MKISALTMDEGQQGEDTLLGGYRVLDLSDQTGVLMGRVLADMGADVIKIERPGGDPMRNTGPFYRDIPGPERSLNWFIFNASKRSVTLDIEQRDGQTLFKKLVKTADFVIECFAPGHLDKLGLGYAALEKINPGIILTSITPFGQTGPYAHWKGSDIIATSMGGLQWLCGDEDRPPIRFSTQAAHLATGVQAAAGTMIAHYCREATGQGQHIDISMQEAISLTLETATDHWWLEGNICRRVGPATFFPPIRRVYPCRDGHFVRWAPEDVPALLDWIEETVGIDPGLKKRYLDEWNAAAEAGQTFTNYLGPERYNEFKETTSKLLTSFTKKEIHQAAKAKHLGWGPCYTLKEVLESEQLKSRDWLVKVEHPELGETFTYPGPICRVSEAAPRIRRRAPLVGEHNHEVLGKEMGLPRRNLTGTAKMGNRAVLQGIKVLDLGWWGVWPLVPAILADLGARVVRIEYPRRPAERLIGPFKDGVQGPDRSAYWHKLNTSKYGMTLDMKNPAALEVARKLVGWADVVGEGYTPGVVEKWGLGYTECRKIKPGIIYVSSSGQGQTGPDARVPMFGHVVQALSGINHFVGWPDRAPVGPWGSWTDWYVPYCILPIVMAALDRQRKTGRGTYIDASAAEAALYGFFETAVLDYFINGREQIRTGNRHPCACPHSAYRCRGEDRWCSIAVFTDQEWQSFCKVIGEPEWTRDSRFATLADRKHNEDELNRLVEAWTGNFSAEEVMTRMQANGVAAGVVQTPRELFEDPQLQHRDHFWMLDYKDVGTFAKSAHAFKLSRLLAQPRPAPSAGEHNEYILKNFLGMTEDEIAELAMAGVFG